MRRWIDRGEISSSRTEGGHRRIDIADALAYARSRGLAHRFANLAGVLGPEALHDALAAGHDAQAIAIANAEFASGRSIASIGDEMLAPAMCRIGTLWNGGRSGVLVEHRATAICAAILHRLASLLPAVENAPRAVGGAIAQDVYFLASLLASTTLQSVGFKTTDLGPNTPLEVLEEAVRIHDPEIVWISLSRIVEQQDVKRLLRFIRAVTAEDRLVVLGGRALEPRMFPALPKLHLASSMRELEALATGVREARSR